MANSAVALIVAILAAIALLAKGDSSSVTFYTDAGKEWCVVLP
mgnify:CR=1 FL=1